MSNTSLANYPTRKQILKHKSLHSSNDLETLKDWKIKQYNNQWKAKLADKKLEAILLLVEAIDPSITHIPWDRWAAQPEKHLLFYNPLTPSIISTLHEIGHLKFGHSELKACAFSVHLFKTVFPDEYNNLKWEGHMLLKK